MNSCNDAIDVLRYIDNDSADRNWKLFVHTCGAVRLARYDSRKSEHSPAFCSDLVPCTGRPNNFEAKWPSSSSSIREREACQESTSGWSEFCSGHS
jgi:hypothetical protein